MVSTRHRAVGSGDEDSDRDAQRPHGGERERRRVDPVLKEAHKRGLDVEKLHGSRTPAWRNLRGRGLQKKQSYFEGPEDEDDELQDQPSEGEEEEEGALDDAVALDEEEDGGSSEESEGEEEEEELGSDRRYARRSRRNDDRSRDQHTGGKSSAQLRRRYQQDRDDSSSDEEADRDGGHPDSGLIGARYSRRQRRQVEFFNPVAYEAEPGSQQPGDSGRRQVDRERERRAAKRLRGGEPSDGSGEEGEEEEGEERRQYSFRDRALVTIRPVGQQQPSSSQGGGASGRHDRKRLRHDRRPGSSRLHRTGSRSRLTEEHDEVADPQDVAAELRAVGQHRGGGGGGGGGAPGGGGRAPWDLVQAAGAALPLSHLGRDKAGNAEITPLQVDPSVTFDTVGGLDHYIKALKEMVFLPLVYPELFERFHISPPRGVLFYGPPGTGKTLVARALAAQASRAGRRVSFFMRKGADILSKWVGEAERQLRLLFEEAQRHAPSIIFFDEIDGLAPVRSSKQDQIHNSIVSTLLALMDGLDSRGQVVVVGATNRVDALDGALRRPGRFDRELVFPLPNLAARADILRIHTRRWAQPPTEELLCELASLTAGYCGADLKALCTEASLASLRRHYPQIYEAEQRLAVDPGRVTVQRGDFLAALQAITPASHRSAAAAARPLPSLVAPVLLDHLQRLLAQLQASFPAAAACMRSGFGGARNPAAGLADDGGGGFSWASCAALGVQRPRLLICGPDGGGQGHLGPAALHALEGLPVHALGLPSLLSDAGARSPEEALVHAVVEARRAAPAILFLPHVQVWWDTAPSSLRATLWMLLADLPPDLPLLLLATADVPADELDPAVQQLFNVNAGGAYALQPPSLHQRAAFFQGVAAALALPPPPGADQAAEGEAPPRPLPVLPRAPEDVAAEEEAKRRKEEAAARQRYEEDQAVLRTLRMALRDLTLQLLGSRRWELFWEPEPADSDWWDKVSEPADLATILSRVDARRYATHHQYLADVGRIVQCAREYWGPQPPVQGVREVSRACALEDEARAALAQALPQPLLASLEDMEARGGPAPPPPGMLAVADAVPADGPTPGPPLLLRRAALPSSRPHSDDVAVRRATRQAASSPASHNLLHTDPEAVRRHIMAQRKLEQQRQQQQQRQQDDAAGPVAARLASIDASSLHAAAADEPAPQQQQEQEAHEQWAEGREEEPGSEPAPAGSAGRGVLAESTKENLPEPAAAAAAVATAVTPAAEGITLSGASAKAAGKGTLTALAEQHAGSRLRREGSTGQAVTPAGADPHQQATEPPAATAGPEPALRPNQACTVDMEGAAAEPGASAADEARAERLQGELARLTEGLALEALEALHAVLSRLAAERRLEADRDEVVAAAIVSAQQWRAVRQ